MKLQEPLAARMRPRDLTEFCGQQHILAPGKPLYMALQQQRLHAMILWGPPGTGKTTFAQLLAQHMHAEFMAISAVLAGVKDIRAALEHGAAQVKEGKLPPILFVDEVHRFNKAQQDAFLPYVEHGDVIFVGATTENPSFELNNALLSRCRVYVFKALTEADIISILQRALVDTERGLGHLHLHMSAELMTKLASAADGDARQALNWLELLSTLANEQGVIGEDAVLQVVGARVGRYDKGGDLFYDHISILHKAVRGSSPDAALYWLARMIVGGCEPLYIARRVVRMATEDIGNADPRALELALNAWDVQERLGSPEGELALAQAVVYMACAPKSNAVYKAWGAAQASAQKYANLPIPMRFRNAPTRLMKEIGAGKEYRYAHDEPYAYAAGEKYFPDEMDVPQYYVPTEYGLEKKIKEKLEFLKKLDEK
ncbi:MAG: replication-associated recombination protein A [Gammaproteobacteria bacterium]